MIDWIPAFTTTSLFAIVLWLGRNLIATRLTKSVQYEFDTKLESLRAKLKENEERFKAELRTKEAEIASLRSGAMTAMVSRQVALDKRRLEAVDQIWLALTNLAPAKNIALVMGGYDFEKLAKESVHNIKLREGFTQLGTLVDVAKLDVSDSARARPFVSPMAWALYSAYQSIVMQAVAKIQIIKLGVGQPELLAKESIVKLLNATLPHHNEYIEKYGDSAFHYLLDELEEKLLDELHNTLEGLEFDKASVAQAAEILKLSNEVMASSKQSTSQ